MQAFGNRDDDTERSAAAQSEDQQEDARSDQASQEVSGEEPKKKRYYSPNEVMKEKGCIGCGGMALATLLLIVGLVLSLVLL